MTRHLDVLVVESHRGTGAAAIAALEAAGHHTATCYPDDAVGFPCRGVVDPTDCPLVDRPDVALLVRRRIAATPATLEQGASCALRAGVPLVEAGPVPLDPYHPWLAARVEDRDVAAVCEAACDATLASLRRNILRLIRPVLDGAGILAAHVACRVEPRGSDLHVQLELPGAVGRRVEQALAVRVLDARRGGRQTYGHHVSVSVSAAG